EHCLVPELQGLLQARGLVIVMMVVMMVPVSRDCGERQPARCAKGCGQRHAKDAIFSRHRFLRVFAFPHNKSRRTVARPRAATCAPYHSAKIGTWQLVH